MKKMQLIFLVLFAAAILNAGDIVIMHTNDIKNTLSARDAVFINPDFPPRLGGLLSLSTAVRYERAKAERNKDIFLLFDSGNFCYKSSDGESIDLEHPALYFNHMGYDAVNFGVDEISAGAGYIKDALSKYNMPVILSNINLSDNSRFGEKYTIIEKEGVKFGIFGMTSEYALFHLTDEVLSEYTIKKEIETAKEIVSVLKANKCDIIIGITSIGYEHDLLLADSVKGIDVIFGGGEGRGMREPVETAQNHTIVFRGYGELSSVERIILKTNDLGGITGYEGNSITVFEEAYPPDLKLESILTNQIVQED